MDQKKKQRTQSLVDRGYQNIIDEHISNTLEQSNFDNLVKARIVIEVVDEKDFKKVLV